MAENLSYLKPMQVFVVAGMTALFLIGGYLLAACRPLGLAAFPLLLLASFYDRIVQEVVDVFRWTRSKVQSASVNNMSPRVEVLWWWRLPLLGCCVGIVVQMILERVG
jgi:hypothetical protein